MTKIALDMDGVIANTHGSIHHEVLSELYDIDLPADFAYQWDAEKCIKHLTGLEITSKEFLDSFQKVWERWDEIPPLDDYTTRFISGAREIGYEVDIVTYAPGIQLDYKTKWIKKNLNGYSPVDMSEFYTIINSAEQKAWKYHMNYGIFVDDCPHIAVGAKAQGKLGILYSQPWNMGVNRKLISKRVGNLYEALEYLKWQNEDINTVVYEFDG